MEMEMEKPNAWVLLKIKQLNKNSKPYAMEIKNAHNHYEGDESDVLSLRMM